MFNFRDGIKKAVLSLMSFVFSLFLCLVYIYCFLFFYNLAFAYEYENEVSEPTSEPTNTTLDFKVNEFSLFLDRSRLIFNKENKGAIFSVENTHEYPMLVQTRVLTEDKTEKSKQFFSTPPLLRLNGKNRSKIRIYSRDLNGTPNDRESLLWICIKGIPPSDNDEIWSGIYGNASKSTSLGVNIAVENCIKMIVRPKGIPSIEYNSGSELVWTRQDNKLRVENISANYINFKSLSINDEVINSPGFILPFGNAEYEAPEKSNLNLEWSLITDLGGESKKYNTKLD